MAKIKIRGQEHTDPVIPLISDYNQISKTYNLQTNRAEAKLIDIGATDDDMICLQFDDGHEWIGHVSEINKIFGDQVKIRGEEDVFQNSLSNLVNIYGIALAISSTSFKLAII